MQTETKTIVDTVKDSAGKPLTVLRFSGDISSTSRDAVLGTYSRLDRMHTRAVLLDFSKVDYINSSGIALVIQLMIEAKKAGQCVSVFGLTPHFQKVFTMVGITKYASLHPDESSAKASAVAA